MKISVLLLS